MPRSSPTRTSSLEASLRLTLLAFCVAAGPWTGSAQGGGSPVTFRPVARYHVPMLNGSVPVPYLAVRLGNPTWDTMRLANDRLGRVLVHGFPMPREGVHCCFEPPAGTVKGTTLLEPGDSLQLEVLWGDSDGPFQLAVWLADGAGSVKEEVDSEAYAGTGPPWADLLSREAALAACTKAVPESIGVARRADLQEIHPRFGRVWRVRCLLRDGARADALIDAISGRLLGWGEKYRIGP